MKKLIAIALLNFGCVNRDCYPDLGYGNYTDFKVERPRLTEFGFYIDDPNDQLNMPEFIRVTRETLDCIKKLEPGWYAPGYEGQCYGKATFEIRACLVIKVAPDWHVSECTGEEVFSCNVPFSSCAEKGYSQDAGCPCSCRSIIQDNSDIIVTPNLKLYPAMLTTLMTGCYNPWVAPLAKCASPK